MILKPCPFCGNTNLKVKRVYNIVVRCKCCGAYGGGAPNEVEAVRKWNRRKTIKKNPTKLTLNTAWTKCLKMWTWIVANRYKYPDLGINKLKKLYLKKFASEDVGMMYDCYFCEYNQQEGGEFGYGNPWGKVVPCTKCPGSLVASYFHCENKSYHYRDNPLTFLRKLRQLNEIRQVEQKENK